jgi:hypothetical protein
MKRFVYALLMAAWISGLSAQAPPDTTITASGIVRATREGSFRWGLFLPAPLRIRSVPVNWLPIDPEAQGVANYEDQFVQATGTLRMGTESTGVANAMLVGPRIKKRDPEGTVRQNVLLSYTQRSVLTLAIAPTRFRWQDSAGHPTGARPLVLFELANQADTPLHLGFPRSEVLCVRVWAPQVVGVDTSWAIVQPGVYQTSIVMGRGYRIVFELPRRSAPLRGRYRLHAALCTATAYGAETSFEIIR